MVLEATVVRSITAEILGCIHIQDYRQLLRLIVQPKYRKFDDFGLTPILDGQIAIGRI